MLTTKLPQLTYKFSIPVVTNLKNEIKIHKKICLNENFPEWWTKGGGSKPWSSQFPDITLLLLLMRIHIILMLRLKIDNVEYIKRRIRHI